MFANTFTIHTIYSLLYAGKINCRVTINYVLATTVRQSKKN